MKKHVLLLLLLIVQVVSKAQLFEISLDKKIAQAQVIAEGQVIDQKSFWNPQHTMIYTANTIKVSRLFKGSLRTQTIEIVTQGGQVGNTYIEASDLLQLNKEEAGIFFCMPGKRTINSPTTNAALLDVYASRQGFLKYNLAANTAEAPFVKYKNISDSLYKLLQLKTGRNITVLDASFKTNTATAPGTTAKGTSTITSFTPTTANAGFITDAPTNLITINGSGFGSPAAPKAVLFKDGNSDDEAPTFSVPYNSPYIVSWNNTQIQVRVPGRAATGRIGVLTANRDTSFSLLPLNIFLAVLSTEFDINGTKVAKEPRLMNANGQGGYTLKYSTNTAGSGVNINNAPEKITFQRALNTWKETVGVNFVEGGTTNTQVVDPGDKENVVMFDNNNTNNDPLPDGVLATTYNSFSMCSNTTYGAQKVGFDIVIRNNAVSEGSTNFTTGPCFPSTAQIDLEFVLLHELGHALNLAHINDDLEVASNGGTYQTINPSKLMHYSIYPYVSRRSLDASAYQSALHAVTPQGLTFGNCSLFAQEMTPLTSVNVSPYDECPGTFDTAALRLNTQVTFDLAHATSNKFGDPQYDNITCNGKGTNVTNNLFYAFKTASPGNATLTISNYATLPADELNCAGQGVRMALYKTAACPVGQQFPLPVVCNSFNTNGTITLDNLAANTSYLLYFDGARNTKASFNVTFTGSALSTEQAPGGTPQSLLNIYPNPTNGNAQLKFTMVTPGTFNVNIIDVNGKILQTILYNVTAAGQVQTLPLKNYPSGMYFIRVTDEAGNRIFKQSIIKLN